MRGGVTYELSIDGKSYVVFGTDKNIVGEVKILEEYKDLPVTGIHHSAFKGCTDITNVIIPNSVTYI